MTSNADSLQLICLSRENVCVWCGSETTTPAGGAGVTGTEHEAASQIDWEPCYYYLATLVLFPHLYKWRQCLCWGAK